MSVKPSELTCHFSLLNTMLTGPEVDYSRRLQSRVSPLAVSTMFALYYFQRQQVTEMYRVENIFAMLASASVVSYDNDIRREQKLHAAYTCWSD